MDGDGWRSGGIIVIKMTKKQGGKDHPAYSKKTQGGLDWWHLA